MLERGSRGHEACWVHTGTASQGTALAQDGACDAAKTGSSHGPPTGSPPRPPTGLLPWLAGMICLASGHRGTALGEPRSPQEMALYGHGGGAGCHER